MNLTDFHKSFGTEQKCRDYFASQRWEGTPMCPHCNTADAYRYSDGRLYKCRSCNRQFTVRVGTIFEDSKVPLTRWFLAIYLATSLKKGISSMQLSRYLGITQKTAWFMLQRIRYALEQSDSGLLQNVVEVDETYVGGDSKNRAYQKKTISDKSVVFGMLEREGKAKIIQVKSSGARILLPTIEKHVKPDTKIFSDQWSAYSTLPRRGFSHQTVNHLKHFKEGLAHTNNIEGFWSHLKRGIDGVYHHVSPKHLQKYCSEYEYRYNTRGISDLERFAEWFTKISCHLTYKELTQ